MSATPWIDQRRIPSQIVRLSVRCESCGHQATVGVPMYGSKMPTLYCGECGDRDPLVEPVRRHYRR